MIKEYLYTTYLMIQSLMPYYSTMQPIKTTYNYTNFTPIYVIEGKYMDSLRIRNFCDTILITQKINQPDNIKFYKVFLNDSEIIK